MVRVRGSIVLALVPGLLCAGGVAVAQEPENPTVVVEAPDESDVRATIAFPDGWRLEAGTDDDSRRYINALAIDERCEFGTRRSDFTDLATDIDDFEITLAPGSGFILIERETVQLPAGEAERIDFAGNEDGGRWSVYSVWDDGFVHELWCRGDELPEDGWLPIAETLDLEPDPGFMGSAFEPTVARADAGVAMAFGEEWRVRGSSANQGLLYATSDTAVCALSDYSAIPAAEDWESLEDMHDEYVTVADARDDLSVEESGYLELMAGHTGFADITFADGTRAIRYSFADPSGETLLALFCVGDPTPDDRYRSLAESLEWRAQG